MCGLRNKLNQIFISNSLQTAAGKVALTEVMKYFFNISAIFIAIFVPWTLSYKLFCYYDINSVNRLGSGKFTTDDMERALKFCTHVVYSYATITAEDFVLTVNIPERKAEFEHVKQLKKNFPNVKFLLSINAEKSEQGTNRFLRLLRSFEHEKATFIKSVIDNLLLYDFDGLSLDFPLPKIKAKPKISSWGKFINLFKKHKDDNDNSEKMQYKDQLTTLIQKLSKNIRAREGIFVLNVLSLVDSQTYIDVVEIIDYLDFVILSAFDFYTPKRNPKEADLMSPTLHLKNNHKRLPLTNVKELYKYWHSKHVPRNKIIIGVAAFGRAWKMTTKSNSNGIPPIKHTNGPAAGGSDTNTPGLLSWPEICEKLNRDSKLKRVIGDTAKSGVYAFRPADSRDNFGIWISYEDPISIAAKAEFVINHNLGGIGLFDISLDDMHGQCNGEKFPILKTLHHKLSKIHSV